MKYDWMFAALSLLSFRVCKCTRNASQLMETLFQDYQKSILPSCDGASTVQLRIGIAVRQIVELVSPKFNKDETILLNEPKQILQTNVWLRLRWEDCNIKWNATETGIDALYVPYDTTWRPDITLYDNAENELGGIKDYIQSIKPDGSIAYNFPTIVKSLCKVDVTYFPFDEQTCTLTFGSWAFHGWDLNISKFAPEGDLSSYVPNVEWEVTGVPAIRHEVVYNCCPEPFPDVTFYIQLKRKPQFYVLSLLFPCILISSMALLGFILPPESGEKVSMEITVLLSVAVFMLMVSETMPPNSETFPYIGIYFACAMLLVSLSCLMTVTVLNLHFKGEHGETVPACVRIIFLEFLGRLLAISKSPNKVKDVNDQELKEKKGGINERTLSIKSYDEKQQQLNDYVSPNKFVDLLDRQLETLQSIDENISSAKNEPSVEEWKTLARVVDRLCLILFLLLQCTGMLVLMCGTMFN